MNEQEKLDRMEQIEIEISRLKQEYNKIFNISSKRIMSFKKEAISNSIISIFTIMVISIIFFLEVPKVFAITISLCVIIPVLYLAVNSWKIYYRNKNNYHE